MQHNKSLLEFYLDDIDVINESQSQEIGGFYKKFSKEHNIDLDELVYGEDGFMSNCYPDGFPDFAGDVIYSEKYWNEFEQWLKDTKGIDLDESLTEAKKKKKPYSSITYTTGDIAYNLKQFNKHMGTDFPGNDNNNPSTEEAKAAAAAANNAVADGAGDASGAGESAGGEAPAGGNGGASAGGACAESLEEGIVFSDKAQRVQIKDLLGTANEYILGRLQAGRDGGDAIGFGSAPHRLSKEDLNLLKDEWIYIEDDGECWWARFEKPVAEIRKLLGLKTENLKEDLEETDTFTPEEQEEYNCDEEGYSLDSYDQYHHCGWCGDVFTEYEMRQEADFGWLCDRCQDELHYHGGPLTFIESKENEALDSRVCVTFKCPECGYTWDETFEKDYFEDEDDLDDVMNNSTNECPECGCEDCFAKSSEYLTEDTLYAARMKADIELPVSIKLLNKQQVIDTVNHLEPEEEFEVGYVTPVFFYSNLVDKFQLLKCTQLTGYTGIDYIEARADDNPDNIAARKQIAKDTAAIGNDVGKHNDFRPNAKEISDFSANYDIVNKTVKRGIHKGHENLGDLNTILFYPTIGQKPRVRYFLKMHNLEQDIWSLWQMVPREKLEKTILDYVQKIAKHLIPIKKDGTAGTPRWASADLAAKIEKQLEEDEKTIEAVTIDAEDRWETRSRLSNGNVAKPQVRALYTNQIYYIKTNKEHYGNKLFESLELTEAKRYVRRYFVRPQQIFCSNKSEILKTLIELGDENCSVYTLNNLGDVKDVTKLTNDDIIYYYDDGILYDKNHVKVMDYDLSIKHEEDRKKYSTEPTTTDLASDEYDDRMTKATVVEYYDGNNKNVDPQSTVKPSKEVPVVNCKKYDVVTHSEDEKPLDCKIEKKPLEKPLTEEADEFVELTDEDFEEDLNEAYENYAIADINGKEIYNFGVDKEDAIQALKDNKYENAYQVILYYSPEEDDEYENDIPFSHTYTVAFKAEDGKVKLVENKNKSLTEAKKDENELPPDPEVVKLETHQELNDLVAGEISTINDYEEVKADIIDKPVEHKDDIIDTINHIEDEEKEHIDELNNVVSEISFGGSHKEAAPAPVVEEQPEEEFVELTDEDLNENMQDPKYLNNARVIYADYDSDDFELNVGYDLQDPDDYEITDEEWILQPGQTAADLVIYLSYECGFNNVYLHGERTADKTDLQNGNTFKAVPGVDPTDWEAYGDIEQRIVEEKEDNTSNKYFACLINGRDFIGYVRAKNNYEADKKMERIWPEYFPAAWDGDNYTVEVNREEIDDDEDEIYDIDPVKDRIIQVKLNTNEVLERDFDINNIDNEFDLAFESYNVYGEKLTEAKGDKFTCCICGEESYGYGNNPYPVKDDGRCCDSCNSHYVIPARLELMQSERADKDND